MSNPAYADTLAIEYLKSKGVPVVRDGWRVLAWGCVRISVRYSTERQYKTCFRWSLPHRMLAQLVMLIMDNDEQMRFFLFDADDAVFYHNDGRLKQNLTFYDGRDEQRKHEEYYEALTSDLMDVAEDRLELIEQKRLEFVR